MGIRAKLIALYAQDHDAMETCWFASRLFGWDWEESAHPRDENGQFTSVGGSGNVKKEMKFDNSGKARGAVNTKQLAEAAHNPHQSENTPTFSYRPNYRPGQPGDYEKLRWNK